MIRFKFPVSRLALSMPKSVRTVMPVIALGAWAMFAADVARAAIVVNAVQTGGNVVISGGGTADLADLSFLLQASLGSFIQPLAGRLYLSGSTSHQDVYTSISGPSNFGPGGTVFPTSSSGDALTIDAGGTLRVTPG